MQFTNQPTALSEMAERQYVPYTQEDYDFIAELTAECEPRHHVPSRTLISESLREFWRDSPTIARLNEAYSFPWSSPIGKLDQHELAMLMDEVTQRMHVHSEHYIRHRDMYCMLALAMNTLRLQAPSFRPQPPIPWRAEDRTPEHMLIQRDRIVIDCHWLHCTKSKVRATEDAWRGIVNSQLELKTEQIEKFASTKISNDYRAESIFNLNDFQQAQMAALRGKSMQKAFKDLGAMVTDATGARTAARFRKIERAIGQWCSSQARFEKFYDKYRAYALATELLSSTTLAQVAQLAGFILGEPPLSDSAARQTIKTLIGRILKTPVT